MVAAARPPHRGPLRHSPATCGAVDAPTLAADSVGCCSGSQIRSRLDQRYRPSAKSVGTLSDRVPDEVPSAEDKSA